jgi:streptogramin lyase
MKNSKIRLRGFGLGLLVLVLTSGLAAAADVARDGNDIGGAVRSTHGPEAGVWVIAETRDLPTRYLKIVVTDDKGRYLLPDLPKATYKVWVRGYGLVDSKPVAAHPGMRLHLEATVAPNALAAAQYYPADYWFSMLQMPPPSDFPGTGPSGNGISPVMKTQQDWVGNLTEGCNYCHQLGSKGFRDLLIHDHLSTAQAFGVGMLNVGRENPPVEGGDIQRNVGALLGQMIGALGSLGRDRALKMFADWSNQIAAGATPSEVPPRPQGRERDVVITEWNWAGDHFLHDLISTDKRDPRVNANGPVVGVGNLDGIIAVLNPATNRTHELNVPSVDNPNKPDIGFGAHTDTMDGNGRVWFTDVSAGPGPASPFCSGQSGNSPYAKYFPRNLQAQPWIGMYDPRTGKVTRIKTCFGTHHLNFANDHDNTLYFSGDFDAVGWINTRQWDETHDWKKSIGWCPFVLDTNGDGKITPDYRQWNQPSANPFAPTPGKPMDPTKDTRISGYPYGMSVAPDGAIWLAKYTPRVPSGIERVTTGKNPPYTCKTQYWEAPKANGLYKAFNLRGVDVDNDGIAWADFGSGILGRFDRRKCKVTKGPAAMGQQCARGWNFYREPGPSIRGSVGPGSAEWSYLTYIDHYNASGLGDDTVFQPGSNSDSIKAFLPKSKKWVIIRIPYPLSAYPRGLDARIDNPAGGWKGREIWSSDNAAALPQVEGGHAMVYEIQVRPNPLAN